MWLLVSLLGCGGLGGPTPPPPKPFAVEEGLKQAPFWSEKLPQREDVQKLFEAATPHQGDLEKGVLFCRFQFPKTLTIQGRFVTREGRLDPVVGVEAPDGRYLLHRFGFNQQEVFLSLPLFDLKKGELWTMRIYDQGRLARDNWVATLKSTYNGELPFVFSQEDPKITIECRGTLRAPAEQMVEREAKALSKEAQELKARLSVDANEADGGFQKSKLPNLFEATEQLAALVGWQDPMLTGPVKEVNDVLASWGKTLKASLPGLSEGAALAESSLRVKVLSESEGQSTLTLDWENKGASDLQVLARLSWLGASCSLEPPIEDDVPRPDAAAPVASNLLKAGEHRAISYTFLAPCSTRKRELEIPRLLFLEVMKGGAIVESTLFWIP